MDFLQLCQRLRQESGVPGTGPNGTTGQTGFNLKLVDWITTAYQDVQSLYSTWKFLQSDFSFTLTSAKRNYTPTEAGLTDHAHWKTNAWGDFRTYLDVSDEQYLEYASWDDYRFVYLFGATRSASGRPTIFTTKPNKSLDFYPIPDDAYNVNGEYFKAPDIFTTNSSEPIFPSQFHLIIIWRALMFYGAYDAADERYVHGQNEYKKVLQKLKADQLPAMSYGAPLA